jgi:NADP-dependent 3-hydroxy acid dehydrogenase YdfG
MTRWQRLQSSPPEMRHRHHGRTAADSAAVTNGIAAGTGLTSEDVADAVLYMLTRPRHINIRDLVMLPINQEI